MHNTQTHFTMSDGSLVRHSDCATVRQNFALHHSDIKTGADLRATLRAGPFTWPGCYPLFFITADGAALSFDSVLGNLSQITRAIRDNDTRSGWCVVGCEVNYEDNGLTCEHSGERIKSAYAED